MLRQLLLAALACVACSASRPVAAAVFQRDWKSPGDGLFTYDDVSGREWLVLTQTVLTELPGTTREAKIGYVQGQTNAGGVYAGFSLAGRDDITQLAESAGIDVSTQDFAANNAAAVPLIELLGKTHSYSGGIAFSVGFLKEVPGSRLGFQIFADGTNSPSRAGLSINNNSDTLSFRAGVALYRQAIPEPSTFAIAATGAFAVTTIRRSGCKPRRRRV